jgi:hypothetical protein
MPSIYFGRTTVRLLAAALMLASARTWSQVHAKDIPPALRLRCDVSGFPKVKYTLALLDSGAAVLLEKPMGKEATPLGKLLWAYEGSWAVKPTGLAIVFETMAAVAPDPSLQETVDRLNQNNLAKHLLDHSIQLNNALIGNYNYVTEKRLVRNLTIACAKIH